MSYWFSEVEDLSVLGLFWGDNLLVGYLVVFWLFTAFSLAAWVCAIVGACTKPIEEQERQRKEEELEERRAERAQQARDRKHSLNREKRLSSRRVDEENVDDTQKEVTESRKPSAETRMSSSGAPRTATTLSRNRPSTRVRN